MKIKLSDNEDNKNLELIEYCNELEDRIEKCLNYINICKTFALVDKVNILSIGVIEHTLKGDDIEDE